jgi:hypothetical protein
MKSAGHLELARGVQLGEEDVTPKRPNGALVTLVAGPSS